MSITNIIIAGNAGGKCVARKTPRRRVRRAVAVGRKMFGFVPIGSRTLHWIATDALRMWMIKRLPKR